MVDLGPLSRPLSPSEKIYFRREDVVFNDIFVLGDLPRDYSTPLQECEHQAIAELPSGVIIIRLSEKVQKAGFVLKTDGVYTKNGTKVLDRIIVVK